MRAVEECSGDVFENALNELIAQFEHMFNVTFFKTEFGGFGKAHDARDVFGAGTETIFVVAAVSPGGDFDAWVDVERAYTFGAVDFVGV